MTQKSRKKGQGKNPKLFDNEIQGKVAGGLFQIQNL